MSILNMLFPKADTSGQEEKLKKMEDIWKDMKSPEYNNVSYKPVKYQQVDSSPWDSVKAKDPDMRNKQMSSISALDEIISGGGKTLQDEANLNRILAETGSAARGRREAIDSAMQSRGMASSGNALLAQLQSSQDATNQASQQGLDIAGQQKQRALNAIMQKGGLASQIRGQDFGEQTQVAGAKDAINKFNAQNRAQTDQYNSQLDRFQQDMNNQIKAMSFNDQMAIAAKLAETYGLGANFERQVAQADANQRAQMISAVFRAGAAYYTYGGSEVVNAANQGTQFSDDAQAADQFSTDYGMA